MKSSGMPVKVCVPDVTVPPTQRPHEKAWPFEATKVPVSVIVPPAMEPITDPPMLKLWSWFWLLYVAVELFPSNNEENADDANPFGNTTPKPFAGGRTAGVPAAFKVSVCWNGCVTTMLGATMVVVSLGRLSALAPVESLACSLPLPLALLP